jgi:4-alpha-glucanotransferase
VRHDLADEIRFFSFVQYLFDGQWKALRAYAADAQIKIIGDVPIYVPLDSVDVWSNPELFQLDEELAPSDVAGVPPDYFSEDGQLWGNPLYRWDVMEKDGFTWWKNRLAAAQQRYDVVRFDHFRGFEAYWAVLYGDTTARGGKWIKGPGMTFIQAIQKSLPTLKLIAEDLGFLTQEVLDLRDDSGLPGMKILEFAFDSREPSDYLPHTYPANSVCYTGTHDNMTMRQWFDTASEEAVEYATEYMALTEEEGLVWGVIRTAFASVSDLAIVQMQDLLELDSKARFNDPSGKQPAWTWRALPGCFDPEISAKLKEKMLLYCRYNWGIKEKSAD